MYWIHPNFKNRSRYIDPPGDLKAIWKFANSNMRFTSINYWRNSHNFGKVMKLCLSETKYFDRDVENTYRNMFPRNQHANVRTHKWP